MDTYLQLKQLLESSPTIRLLREQKCALIIAFLRDAFEEKTSVALDVLIARLADFLEETDDDIDMDEEKGEAENRELSGIRDSISSQRKARLLLQRWEDKERRYVAMFNNERGEQFYRLTPHFVKAAQWVESLEQREFVGTHSRFEDVLEKLRKLVQNSREKTPEEQIAELETQREVLEREIAQIRSGQPRRLPYDKNRIREEYAALLELASSLSADFKEVEANFDAIRNEILRRQVSQDQSKGQVLRYTLDARDELEQTPQGKSFYGFYQLLMDERRQHELHKLTDELYVVMDELGIPYPNKQLRKLPDLLHAESQDVISANRRLTERVTRVVSEQNLRQRKLSLKIIGEIKQAALSDALLRTPPPPDQVFWEISGYRPALHLPLERPLLQQPESARTAFVQPERNPSDEQPNLVALLKSYQIDLDQLRQNVERLLDTRSQVTLLEVTEAFGISKGLYEALGYLHIAAQEPRHHVSEPDSYMDTIVFDSENQRCLDMPRVIFSR